MRRAWREMGCVPCLLSVRSVGTEKNLLSALLHIRAHEVLSVLLEHVVDLVQDRVDVLAELLPAFLTSWRGAVDVLVAVTAALPVSLFLSHLASRIGACLPQDYRPALTISRIVQPVIVN